MPKAALSKVVHGLLVGIGFATALAVLLYGYDRWQTSKMEEQASEMDERFRESLPVFKNYSSDARLTIKNHRPQTRESNSAFLGSIQNAGVDTWQSVEVLVELFDKEGTFVDKCSSYLDGSIGPGQIRNFKVSCSECRDAAQRLAYDRYRIEIVSASYVQLEAKPIL